MTREVMRRFAEGDSGGSTAAETGTLPGFLRKTVDGPELYAVPRRSVRWPGRSPVSNVLNIEDLARGDMSLAIAAMAPLAVINCVMDYGTDAHKEKVSQALATADFTPAAMALMEPGIGFDARRLSTRAVRQAERYVIDGAKHSGLQTSRPVLLCSPTAGTPAPGFYSQRRQRRHQFRERGLHGAAAPAAVCHGAKQGCGACIRQIARRLRSRALVEPG
jgi:hypothetical protein